MTPPTGYRLATADDLREGVEVLIPATVNADGDLRVIGSDWVSATSQRCRLDIGRNGMIGLALVRDGATADEEAEPISVAEHGIKTRALSLIRAALAVEDRDGDDITIAYRVVDIMDRGRGNEADLNRQIREARASILTLTIQRDAHRDRAEEAVTERDALRARAEKAEADLLNLHADLAARDLMVAECDRIRRDLATATDEVMQSAGRYGRFDAMIKAAAVLCEIDADGAEERLSALVERARGGR